MADNVNSVKMGEPRPPGKGAGTRAYHHGALREALIAASEAIIAERGVAGFSLREAARRVGVSPAAPTHHFKDARGLLTAIAARAFSDLAAALTAGAQAGGPDPASRLRGMGIAYVRFALAQPARFDLMWRMALLDHEDAAFSAAAHGAFAVLAVAVGGQAPEHGCGPPRPGPSLVAAWSLVHGFARLALDGAFDPDTPGLLEAVVGRLDVPELRAGDPSAGPAGGAPPRA